MPKFNELSEKQDRELVELLVGGSQAALGELYARYSKQLIYLCKQFLKDETDAEDIVQDIFLKLWETRHLLGAVSSFSGFAKTMTKNHAKDKLKHADVHLRFARNMLINGIDLTNETEESIIDNDYTELLNELIERLPPKQKEIFRLSRIEGFTYKEISELKQLSIENVRKHASLSTKKIEEQINQYIGIHFKTVIFLLLLFL